MIFELISFSVLRAARAIRIFFLFCFNEKYTRGRPIYFTSNSPSSGSASGKKRLRNFEPV